MIRIGADNEKTRNADDIIEFVFDRLAADIADNTDDKPAVSIDIFKDIEIEGDGEFRDNNVNVFLAGNFARYRGLGYLLAAVERFFDTRGRVCFSIIETPGENGDADELDYCQFPSPTRTWLHRTFWRDGLLRLREAGAAVFVLSTPDSALIKDMNADADCFINLPDLFYDSAEDAAITDLINLLIARGLASNRITALPFAKFLLTKAQYRPKYIYSSFSGAAWRHIKK